VTVFFQSINKGACYTQVNTVYKFMNISNNKINSDFRGDSYVLQYHLLSVQLQAQLHQLMSLEKVWRRNL
jgi:hypothetical protein